MPFLRQDIAINYPDGNRDRPGIVCAHCGFNKEATVRPNFAYVSCECPGHISHLLVGLEEMENLPERVESFLDHLENEPCQAMRTTESGHEYSSCMFHSFVQHMCPACRLRHIFFLNVYAWRNHSWIDPGVNNV